MRNNRSSSTSLCKSVTLIVRLNLFYYYYCSINLILFSFSCHFNRKEKYDCNNTGADTGYWKGGLSTKTCRICVHTHNVFSPLFEVLGSLKSVCVCAGGGGGDLDPPLQ